MKNKIFSVIFVLFLSFFMILSIILPDKKISVSERRTLASFPGIEVNSVFNGEFFENLNNYLVEQFPLRDLFRNIKGIISKNIFKKNDENGIFIKNNSIYQLNSNLNENSIEHFTSLVNKINKNYIKSNNVYYSIIPDKNYYLDNIPKMDYSKLEVLLKNNLVNMQYIDIKNELNLDSFYQTDIHWKQEKLSGVLNKLEKTMNLNTINIPSYSKSYNKFYGALYGRIANNLKPDILTYLIDYNIDEAKVFDYEKQKYRRVYEEKDLENIDSYDIYLGGAKALLVIENNKQTNNRELILFRDSFGSSITPLLISNYSKITLIDLRYINSNLLDQVGINWDNDQDILFLYSVPIINNSFTLK